MPQHHRLPENVLEYSTSPISISIHATRPVPKQIVPSFYVVDRTRLLLTLLQAVASSSRPRDSVHSSVTHHTNSLDQHYKRYQSSQAITESSSLVSLRVICEFTSRCMTICSDDNRVYLMTMIIVSSSFRSSHAS